MCFSKNRDAHLLGKTVTSCNCSAEASLTIYAAINSALSISRERFSVTFLTRPFANEFLCGILEKELSQCYVLLPSSRPDF